MWDILQFVLSIVTIVLAIVAVLQAITSPRWTKVEKALWIAVIIVLPLAGAIAFFIFDRLKARS